MAKMHKMGKAAKMVKTAETAKMAETAKTGLGWANRDNPLALLKITGQERACSDFYHFFPERQLNLVVKLKNSCKTAMHESLTQFNQKYSFEMKDIQFPINSFP